MEASLTKNKNSLKSKIPDIKSNIEIVKLLMEKKVHLSIHHFIQQNQSNNQKIETQFELADGFYGNATVTPSTVCLWLGVRFLLHFMF
jgi:hypothetical protein